MFNDKCEPGTIAHGPGSLCFFGINILHAEDMTILINADYWIPALDGYPISRIRHKQTNEVLSVVKRGGIYVNQ